MRFPAPPPLVFSANIRLRTAASFTTIRKLLKQHREHFHSNKSNDIESRAAFPDSITPMERVRAQVKPPLSSLYTEDYSAVNIWLTPQQHSASINNLNKRCHITGFSMRTGIIASKEKAPMTSLRSDTSLRRSHVLILTHLSGCVFQPRSVCLPHGLPLLDSL